MGSAFRVRLLMIEYFTVKDMGFGDDNYSFVTFKSIEKMIDDAILWLYIILRFCILLYKLNIL